jgi:propanol-preferring alcohol dehydrogenase
VRAVVFERVGDPLRIVELPDPEPGAGEVLVAVRACGVCRTDLHVVDGELASPKRPWVIPGHEIVGDVVATGEGVDRFKIGDRVGVPWLGWTCERCAPCRAGRENLCERARFTGYTLDGGYAELTVADARYAFRIGGGREDLDDVHAAPLLCAGLIGYRSLRISGPPEQTGALGLYGFGAAAHIVTQIARHRGQRVFAFVRPGDTAAEAFARELGAEWAGPSDALPPEPLDAAIIYAPVGALVPAALRAVRPGGTVVCAGIHMSDIPTFPYELLWGERCLRSVANLERRDGDELLTLAAHTPIETRVETFPLGAANQALARLREGRLTGAAVLVP